MHRLKSTSNIHRFRLAALLLCVKYVLFPTTFWVLLQALTSYDQSLAIIGVELVVLFVLIAILQWLAAARTGCPLCMTPVLARKKCVTHRQARALLGSYRLRVALSILFKNTFLCPYCHEPTLVAARDRKRGSQPPDSRG